MSSTLLQLCFSTASAVEAWRFLVIPMATEAHVAAPRKHSNNVKKNNSSMNDISSYFGFSRPVKQSGALNYATQNSSSTSGLGLG